MEKRRIKKWLSEFHRPELGWWIAWRVKRLDQERLRWHLFQVGGQHPEHDLEDWVARATARALCERYRRFRLWPLLPLVLLVCAIPATAQGIDVIHVKNNGTTAGTIAGPFTLNCVETAASPCAVTSGPKTLTLTMPTGGGSGYIATSWVWGNQPISREPAGVSNQGFSPTVNKVSVWGVEISTPIQVSHVLFDVTLGDSTGGLYSWGMWGPLSACTTTCPLVASTAAATYNAVSGGQRYSPALIQGLITIQPGVYFEGFTGNKSTAMFALSSGFGNDRYVTYLGFDATSPSSGGAAPATINTPVLQFTAGISLNTILPLAYLTQLPCGPSC